MNRELRRKLSIRAANLAIKAREKSVQKKQFGFGIVVTNCMLTIVFWRWTWTPWDRRLG